MASISNDANGTRRILFVAPDGSRKTLYLGKVDAKTAQSICFHVENLLASKMTGEPLQRQSAAWLVSIGQALREKLENVGLVEAPKRLALGEFLRSHVLNRPDVRPATLEIWQQPCRNLIEFFGDGKPLRSITAGDAESFKAWMLSTQNLAPATLAKRLAFARTFLHTARKHKLIDENPFAELKIPTANVSARQSFVTREMTQRLLDVASPTWRTIIALCRFGGLRCPSEVLSLEWRHIDWQAGRITVPSPKTSRYDGKGSRVIPLFEDLRPYLMEAFELAEPGQTHIIGGDYLAKADTPSGWRNVNLRTPFERLIERAGLEPWPKMFHNLRSSRETELLETFPLHVVSKWMGHDAKVSLRHYAQTHDDHFERARGNAESNARATQNPTQQIDASKSIEQKQPPQNEEGEAFNASPCDLLQSSEHASNGEGGIRSPRENPLELAFLEEGNAESNAVTLESPPIDPELSEVLEAWEDLPEGIRLAVLALVRTSSR